MKKKQEAEIYMQNMLSDLKTLLIKEAEENFPGLRLHFSDGFKEIPEPVLHGVGDKLEMRSVDEKIKEEDLEEKTTVDEDQEKKIKENLKEKIKKEDLEEKKIIMRNRDRTLTSFEKEEKIQSGLRYEKFKSVQKEFTASEFKQNYLRASPFSQIAIKEVSAALAKEREQGELLCRVITNSKNGKTTHLYCLPLVRSTSLANFISN